MNAKEISMQEKQDDMMKVSEESVVPFVNAVPSDMDQKLKAKIQKKSEAEKRKKKVNRKRNKAQRAARRRQRRN
jgi:hypothetical protein